MLIAHLSDTHLGHRYLHHVDNEGRNVREQDVYAAFNAALNAIIEIQPACVVHAGDFFDSYHPSTRALTVALDGLARLRNAGIPFVGIAGNHSTPRQRSTEHVFSLLSRFGGELIWQETRVVRVDGLAIHGIPHQHDAAALAANVAAASPIADADYNVLLLHGGFDTLSQVGAGEPGSITLDPEVLQAASDFDYVALGHLHIEQPARLNAYYAGSLERLSFADSGRRKGFVVVDLSCDPTADARLRLEEVATRPFFELAAIDAGSGSDPLDLLEKELRGRELERAIVRCRVANVDPGAWRALDRRRLQELTCRCLHFELLPLFDSSATVAVGAPSDLRTFVAAHTPTGLKADDLFARAQDYLARSTSKEGE
jgi:DNA repair protein SbcD/Mre11